MNIELNAVKLRPMKIYNTKTGEMFDLSVEEENERMAWHIEAYRHHINNSRFAKHYMKQGIDPALCAPAIEFGGQVFAASFDELEGMDNETFDLLVHEKIAMSCHPFGMSQGVWDEKVKKFFTLFRLELGGFMEVKNKDISGVAFLYRDIGRLYDQIFSESNQK